MRRTPFLNLISCWGGPVLSVQNGLEGSKVYGWNLTGKNGLSAYITLHMDCSSQPASGR